MRCQFGTSSLVVRFDDACRDAGHKHFLIPKGKVSFHNGAGIVAFENIGDASLDFLKGLPIATCGQCVALIGIHAFGFPAFTFYFLNQIIGHSIAFVGRVCSFRKDLGCNRLSNSDISHTS